MVDTAGIDYDGRDSWKIQMREQTWIAARQADLILLLLDGKAGSWLSHAVLDMAKKLRSLQQHDNDDNNNAQMVRVLVNKLEGDAWVHHDGDSWVLENLQEVETLGFGEAIPISAEHGEGLADLAVLVEECIHAKNPTKREEEEEIPQQEKTKDERPLQLAILGRQNVGKSTLVNALLRQERVIAGEMPGLTRDAISIPWHFRGRPVRLVDTAGIQKVTQRHSEEEDLAVQDAMRAMKLADVAVLVLDAQAGVLQRQELAIADAVVKEGRSLVIAANKMDLLVDKEYTPADYAHAVRNQVQDRIPVLRRTPVVPMSSLTGRGVDALMPVVLDARDRWERVLTTGLLNRWMAEVMRGHPPPRGIRLKYMMQTKGRPPTFLLFCNVEELPASYIRFLIRNFQDAFSYFGMEVRIVIKKTANPYAREKKRSGSGLGGCEARKQRTIQELKATGSAKRKRKRRNHNTYR